MNNKMRTQNYQQLNLKKEKQKQYTGKNKQMGLYLSKKLLHIQRKHQQNGKGTNRMGKHICQ